MPRFNNLARYRRTNGFGPVHRAVDHAAPKNTIVRAPEAGVYYRMPDELQRTPGKAGRWGKVVFPNGEAVVICHGTRHIARNRAKVVKGQALMRSGNTGYVLPPPTRNRPDNGHHVHSYGLRADGSRFDWTVGSSSTCTGYVSAKKGLRLRSKASTLSKTITVLPFGTKVRAIGFRGQWWKIKHQGKTGWVHAKFLK